MDNFKIYSVTDEYIDYLRIIEPNVYSNKVENRIHTRKYIGTVLEIQLHLVSPTKYDWTNVANVIAKGY